MGPSRMIDALVAEKIFGWKWQPSKEHDRNWLVEDGVYAKVVPEYSSDFLEALRVVDKLRELNYGWKIERSRYESWSVECRLFHSGDTGNDKNYDIASFVNECLPASICVVALAVTNSYRDLGVRISRHDE